MKAELFFPAGIAVGGAGGFDFLTEITIRPERAVAAAGGAVASGGAFERAIKAPLYFSAVARSGEVLHGLMVTPWHAPGTYRS